MNAPSPLATDTVTLVTGASGFVGGRLARRLLGAGRRVRAVARSPLSELAALGAETMRADIADPAAMDAACRGVGTVFHAAARVGVWGPRVAFERTNIGGAQAIVAGCRTHGVARLVFTSSPSVVFCDADLAGVDEAQPRGTDFPADYPRTKAEAERLILAAHEPGRLATCALRPHLIWGVGDQNLIPRVVARARAGRLRIVGAGKNVVDLTHVENVVDAHLDAERALAAPACPAGGCAYFITNGEPVVLWDWINDLLGRLDVPPVTRRISLANARRIGAVCEALWSTLRLRGEPPMTRFVASELAKDHWFRIDAARRDLGYAPRVTMAQGLDELVRTLR
ncbi:MAG: NAD-dependent epimerase/dehydratase family protein [Opitutaceae bacterium]|nr:NAD-dependent epimerase/dehydratase family protein [Opitutaceae bacterium]